MPGYSSPPASSFKTQLNSNFRGRGQLWAELQQMSSGAPLNINAFFCSGLAMLLKVCQSLLHATPQEKEKVPEGSFQWTLRVAFSGGGDSLQQQVCYAHMPGLQAPSPVGSVQEEAAD